MTQFTAIAVAILISLSVTKADAQGMAINTTGAAADQSAMLDVTSTSQGILVPRMTAMQRTNISMPATGLLVYQTDGTAGFYYNSGTPGTPNWTSLNASAGAAAAGTLTGTTLASNVVNASVSTLSNLTTNGVVTTSGGTGALSVTGTNVANGFVLLDGSGKLPTLNGSAVTNLDGAHLTAATVPVTAINATGTASASTYLTGAGTWATPSTSSSGAGGATFCQNLTLPNASNTFVTLSSGIIGSGVTNAASAKATVIPFSATVDGFYVQLFNASGGTSTTSDVFTIYKNGIATSMTISLTSPTTAGGSSQASTTSGSFSVSAGDYLSIFLTSTTPSVGCVMSATVHMH